MRLQKINGRCNICGMRVREARESAALSQEQLAAKMQLQGLSMTQKAISRIESGDRVIPDYEIAPLAAVLNVPVLWLLGIARDPSGD